MPADRGPVYDPWLWRLIVAFLGSVIIVVVILMEKLTISGRDIPPSLPAIGMGALVALTSLLPSVLQRRFNGGAGPEFGPDLDAKKGDVAARVKDGPDDGGSLLR